jgi:hypothetical protein
MPYLINLLITDYFKDTDAEMKESCSEYCKPLIHYALQEVMLLKVCCLILTVHV